MGGEGQLLLVACDGIQNTLPFPRHLHPSAAWRRNLKTDQLARDEGADIGWIQFPVMVRFAKNQQRRNLVRT